MSANVVRADYDELTKMAAIFGQHADQTRKTLQHLSQQMETLQQGDWLGGAAQKFYAEMNSGVVPTISRLVRALEAAQQTTLQITNVIKTAEDEAAGYLRANGQAAPAGLAGASGVISGSAAAGLRPNLASRKMRASGGLLSKVGGFFSSAAGHASDFVVGAGKELFSIGKGIVLTVAAPAYATYQTVKGLWHVANNPRAAWEALKKPYVDAWNSGRPFEAIGRGYIFVGSLFVGGAEVKAGMEASHAADLARKAARAADEASQVGRVAKMADAAEAAGGAGKVGKASTVEDALAKEKRQLEEMAQAGKTDGAQPPKVNQMSKAAQELLIENRRAIREAEQELAELVDDLALRDLIRQQLGKNEPSRNSGKIVQNLKQIVKQGGNPGAAAAEHLRRIRSITDRLSQLNEEQRRIRTVD